VVQGSSNIAGSQAPGPDAALRPGDPRPGAAAALAGAQTAWRHWTAAVAGLALPAIFAFDIGMPLGVASALPYIAVVSLGLWAPQPRFCLWIAAAATALTVAAIGLKPAGHGVFWIVALNRALIVAGIWITAFLVEKSRNRDLHLRAIVDTAVDGIVTIDADGLIRTFNPGAERLFGYRASEVVGRSVGLLMPEPEADRHQGHIRRYLDTGTARIIGRGREVTARRADGSTFPIQLAVSAIRAGGAPIFAGIIHDLTDLRRAEAELRRHRDHLQQQVEERTKDLALAKAQAEEAYRTKSAFLAGMSHELRTPLNAVIGFSELLKTKTFGSLNEKQAEYVDAILESARHLLALINDVLDLSKVEAGRMKLKEEAVDIADVIEQARRVLEPAIGAGDLSFTAKVAADCTAMQADRRLLFQVLLNLLSNACKFTPRGGHVAVAASALGRDGVSVQIADTGIGMTAEEIATALKPFGRADNPLTRSREGTGLGLSLSKNLVELHGGRLDIASAPGKGTTVTLLFPGRRADRAAA
jgi:PAS domain S-box-containing protein